LLELNRPGLLLSDNTGLDAIGIPIVAPLTMEVPQLPTVNRPPLTRKVKEVRQTVVF
jgi:hypothetical protein